ncbi:unnamed protein product [Macrosiphum euphorbiae]|uniref:Insertion element IS150 protein InsJ-like helix-turn-helix domain-containing protein n=1 Tax=Macrosiphum euphorbiae TaxID=13131 RepID=A0AAV0XR43_9HEMI|nr:unnamed protein product [Macrosiphum euphorbiae]
MTSKNKCLTLNEKIKLIESSEKDKLTVKQICELFKCGKSQVYTVKKCFIKAGFNLVLDQPTDAINDNDNDFKLLCSTINEKVDSDEYVNIDKHLCTNDTDIIADTTVKPCTSIDVEQSSSEDETDNVPLHGNDIKTYKNALHEIKRLEMFALDQNNENELLESILNLKNLVEKKMASQITKQKTLDEFWSKI